VVPVEEEGDVYAGLVDDILIIVEDYPFGIILYY
jgi:hypothetical protein